MHAVGTHLLLFGVGVVAGALNVIAGGGSFLTLPILMFLGLPAGVANGTNRVGILLQNVGAVWSFRRDRVLDWKALSWAAAPSLPGAILGTWLALIVSDQVFKRILAILIVTLCMWTLWRDRNVRQAHVDRSSPPHRVWMALAFFAIGVYGGFVQAGVGFLILAVLLANGFELVRGNAIKVLTVLCFTVLALVGFAAQDRIDWWMGLVLGMGNFEGGLLGAHLTVIKGHQWVRIVVTATMIVFAVKLWFFS
ncbi:MAG: sulfite exporter TauE/SafE family protein [Acidobacteriota bacterium]